MDFLDKIYQSNQFKVCEHQPNKNEKLLFLFQLRISYCNPNSELLHHASNCGFQYK